MIAFKDFAPRQKEPKAFMWSAQYATFDDVVAQANAWLEENRGSFRLISIETVVLPNQTMQNNANYWTTVEGGTRWHQIMRVWYDTSGAENTPR